MKPGSDPLHVACLAGRDLLSRDGSPWRWSTRNRATREGAPPGRTGRQPICRVSTGQPGETARPSEILRSLLQAEESRQCCSPSPDGDGCRDAGMDARRHVQEHDGSVEPEYDGPQTGHAGARAPSIRRTMRNRIKGSHVKRVEPCLTTGKASRTPTRKSRAAPHARPKCCTKTKEKRLHRILRSASVDIKPTNPFHNGECQHMACGSLRAANAFRSTVWVSRHLVDGCHPPAL